MFQSSVLVCKEKRALVKPPQARWQWGGVAVCVEGAARHRGASWCCQRLAVGLEKPPLRLHRCFRLRNL